MQSRTYSYKSNLSIDKESVLRCYAEESGGSESGAGVNATLRHQGKLRLAVGTHVDSEVEFIDTVLSGNRLLYYLL